MDEIGSAQPSLGVQPITPIPHLKILQGWSCLPCGGQYLTTSFELLARHLAAEHGVTHKDAAVWESCDLQTFFQETKHRRYFRVRGGQDSSSCSELSDMNAPSTLAPPPTVYHPFACHAKEHVQWLPLSYLDRLFKSGAFALASEPLFNPGHVDAEFGPHKVFPLCHQDPVFSHALLCSMVQLSHGQTTVASALQRATVNLIRSRLSSPPPHGLAPLVGAIMILRGTAYKLGDSATHDIHACGLEGILRGEAGLTVAAKKAVFWQSMYAAICLDRPCQSELVDLFEQTDWLRRTPLGQSEPCQAVGFLRHQDILPPTLLDCVVDILELQSTVSILTATPFHERYRYLDSMQASIESRLMSSRSLDPVVEAVRLGVFVCCYCSWVEIWNDKYIPCLMAAKLFDKLETGDFVDWASRLDLFLWLLFVGSCVGSRDPRRQTRLLSRTRLAMELYPANETRYAMHRALQEYLYCQDWLSSRSSMQEWYRFEIWIRTRPQS